MSLIFPTLPDPQDQAAYLAFGRLDDCLAFFFHPRLVESPWCVALHARRGISILTQKGEFPPSDETIAALKSLLPSSPFSHAVCDLSNLPPPEQISDWFVRGTFVPPGWFPQAIALMQRLGCAGATSSPQAVPHQATTPSRQGEGTPGRAIGPLPGVTYIGRAADVLAAAREVDDTLGALDDIFGMIPSRAEKTRRTRRINKDPAVDAARKELAACIGGLYADPVRSVARIERRVTSTRDSSASQKIATQILHNPGAFGDPPRVKGTSPDQRHLTTVLSRLREAVTVAHNAAVADGGSS